MPSWALTFSKKEDCFYINFCFIYIYLQFVLGVQLGVQLGYDRLSAAATSQ